MSRSLRRFLIAIFSIALATATLLAGLSGLAHVAYGRKIYTTGLGMQPDAAPRVALIFGLWQPSDAAAQAALSDRIRTVVEFLDTTRAHKILIMGTPQETLILRNLAQQFNVAADRLVVDDGSPSAYAACYRAREMYGVDRAILVAQHFQLDRLLYVCSKLGVDSFGLLANRQDYDLQAQTGWQLSEMVHLVGDWLDINVLKPVPALGAITPTGN